MNLQGYRKMSLLEIQSAQLQLMKQIHQVCVKYDIKYYIIAGTLLGAVRHGGFIPWDDDIDIAMMREDFEKFKQISSIEFDESRYFLQSYDTDFYLRPALIRICFSNTIKDIPSEAHLKHCKSSYLDIFPLDNAPDTIKLQKKHSCVLTAIDTLMRFRYYQIYDHDNCLRILLKKLISLLLTIIPIQVLKNKRLSVMQQYNNQYTKYIVSTVSQYAYSRQTMPREFYGEPTLINFEDTAFYAPEQTNNYLTQLYGANYLQIPPLEKRRTPTDVYIKIEE